MTKLNKSNILYLDKYLNVKRGDNMGMSETLKAISDPARREILEMLKEGKKTVTSVPNQEVKLKKGETYKVNYNNSFAWAKEKAVKVK